MGPVLGQPWVLWVMHRSYISHVSVMNGSTVCDMGRVWSTMGDMGDMGHVCVNHG